MGKATELTQCLGKVKNKAQEQQDHVGEVSKIINEDPAVVYEQVQATTKLSSANGIEEIDVSFGVEPDLIYNMGCSKLISWLVHD